MYVSTESLEEELKELKKQVKQMENTQQHLMGRLQTLEEYINLGGQTCTSLNMTEYLPSGSSDNCSHYSEENIVIQSHTATVPATVSSNLSTADPSPSADTPMTYTCNTQTSFEPLPLIHKP